MRAVVIHETGDPDVLIQEEIATPEIHQPNEVLVRLKAAGVNPVDTKLRKGLYPLQQFPAILGCDGAGIVAATGDAVTRCRKGDAVYFFHGGIGNGPGNYAEYILLDERFVARKPEQADFIHAAALPLVFITAWEALHDRTRIQPGQSVLIHAGAGGVGHIAIQIAKAAGAHVLTTVSSREKAEFVSSLGADFVIDYKKENFVDAVMEYTSGTGVDIVMDNVGGEVTAASFPAVKHYGDLVTLLQVPDKTDWTVARMRNLRFSFEIMLTPLLYDLKDAQQHQTWILEQCARMVDENSLRVHVSDTFPMEEIRNVHRNIESGSTTGKIVLAID